MAGARIEFDRSDYDRAISALQESLGEQGRKLLFKDIGEYLVRATRDRAETQRDPNGNAWQALSPPYKKWKARNKPGLPILKLNFEMLGPARFTYQAVGSTLYVGTSAVYGATHQYGRDGIPARPWLGITRDDQEEIPLIVKDHIMAAFGGR